MNIILYTQEDGMLCIINNVCGDLLSDVDFGRAFVPDGIPFVIADDSVIPTDTTFRNAWTYDTTSNPDGIGASNGTIISEFADCKFVKGQGFVAL